MTLTFHRDMIQGSDEWRQARCGLITASEMKLLVTLGGKPSDNDKTRAHIWELAAQRISQNVEPSYIGDDMLRGHEDEILARDLYAKHFAPVEEVGFITDDRWGFTLGYSPDGLVGDDGQIECKSRRQKFQVETIARGVVPDDHLIQVQTGLLVTGRAWCDYVSYCGGLPLCVVREVACAETQAAILEAAKRAEDRIADCIANYHRSLSEVKVIPTDRRVEQEMVI